MSASPLDDGQVGVRGDDLAIPPAPDRDDSPDRADESAA